MGTRVYRHRARETQKPPIQGCSQSYRRLPWSETRNPGKDSQSGTGDHQNLGHESKGEREDPRERGPRQHHRGTGETQGKREIMGRPLHGMGTSTKTPTIQHMPRGDTGYHGREWREGDPMALPPEKEASPQHTIQRVRNRRHPGLYGK